MWKLLCAFLLFLICVLMGGAASEKLKKRADMLSMLLADMKTFRSGLQNENLSVGRIVSELSESGNLRDFWLEMKKEVDLNRSFGEACSKAENAISGLDKKEFEEFKAFAADFGTDDTQSELGRIDTLIEKFEEKERMYKCEYPKKIKLLRSLSLLGGLALALMLL